MPKRKFCEKKGGHTQELQKGLEFPTDLLVIDNGAMNADRYLRNILEEHVVPIAAYIGENFIFMDDNSRPHRARIVQEYLEEVEVSRIEWPARSPDLNLIEQVWDNLNRRL